MDLTVAIINYNTRDRLRNCLASLPSRVRGEPLRILVLDNASPDGSASMVATHFRSKAELVANRANIGFARAVNQALGQCKSRYLLVLNADIEVTEGAIESLYDFMEATPRAGIAAGKLVDEKGELQPSCRRFYTPLAILLRRTPLGRLFPDHPAVRRHLMLDWDHASARTVDWVQGACLMIRLEAVAQVGSMDERFFLYFEDVDLCRRMAEGGWPVYYVPQATFVHSYQRGSFSSGPLSLERLQHLASGLSYFAKWHPVGGAVLSFMRRITPLLLLLLDLALINGSFLLALWLRDRVGGALPEAATRLETYLPVLAGTNGLLVLCFAAVGLYRLQRSADWLATCSQAVKAVTWVAMAGLVFLFFAPSYRSGFVYSRLVLLIYYILLVLATCLSRLLIKRAARFLWSRHVLLRPVVIVGEPDALNHLAEAIRADPGAGYKVVATLALSPIDSDDLDASVSTGFQRLLQDHTPQGVIFVAHRRSFRSYVPLVLRSLERDLEVRVATSPDLFPYISHRIGEIGGHPAADVTRTPFYALKCAVKRTSDFTAAMVALLAVLPLLLVLGLIVYLYDRGPVFFLQHRVGKHGRLFRIIKLRTMTVNAHVDAAANVAEGPLILIPNDPRVTPVGRWLRRHKLDELPQLINVLAGDMSLVGPRPPISEEVDQYTQWQMGRLFVRPGLTGLWQIDKERKWRFNEMVELDLQYILNWSLLLDYSLILRTLPVVLRGS